MPRLVFLYAEQSKGAGSTVMRGFQLADLARHALRRHSVRIRPLGARTTNATVFLTKGALRVATPTQLDDLLRTGNRLLFDPVDELPPDTTARFADVLIASSLTAFEEYGRSFPGTRVALVNHHVDPRIDTAPIQHSAFRAGYFGERVNAVLTQRIDTSREDSGWLSAIRDYSFHYAVRRHRELDHYKPFLKGFTAAHCGAPILIQRDQQEAVRWLGDDYPYLVDPPVSEEQVLDALAEAESDFGGPRWQLAQATMAGIRARTTAQRISEELAAAVL
jgi:hypothetical protein